MVRPTRFLSLAALMLGAAMAAGTPAARAQPAPIPVTQLLRALPELPDSAELAATWVDRHGRVVHRGLLATQAAIASHRQALAAIAQQNAAGAHAQGELGMAALGRGMAEAGIDMQRLRTDPAYASQVQERVRRMTPGEQMEFAQRLARPMNQDPRVVNPARAMVEEPSAVQAAAAAGQAYTQDQLARLQRQTQLWQATEDAVRQQRAQRLTVALPKPAMEWDNIGCDKGCQARWDAYAEQMLPLMLQRETRTLQLRRAALQRQRSAIMAELQAAEQLLVAAGFGADSRSQANQAPIQAYDGAVVAEVEWLLARSIEAVQSAAVLPNCGKQAVLVPLAVCR